RNASFKFFLNMKVVLGAFIQRDGIALLLWFFLAGHEITAGVSVKNGKYITSSGLATEFIAHSQKR
ncbi:hypothetical protein, partial [Oleiphilus sp. HI0066]|uniref:hypothetical protein n=1 Tax=Oleiphilus sp. HI0066 TaxID=1822242 RepID=UPI000B2E968B